MIWEPKAWLQKAVDMQKIHPFVPVELNREEALALLKHIETLEETAEALKRQLAGDYRR